MTTPPHSSTVRWGQAVSVSPSLISFVQTGVHGAHTSLAVSPLVARADVRDSNPTAPSGGANNVAQLGRSYGANLSNINSLRKRAKSQHRRDIWLQNRATIEQKRKYRALLKGYRDFQRKSTATEDDIVQALERRNPDAPDSQLNQPDSDQAVPRSALDAEHREMAQLIELLREGGVGYAPKHKPDGYVRLMFENWNSLGVFTHNWKLDCLNYMIKDFQVDLVAGCETQCNWNLVPPQRQFLHLLCPGISTVGLASHNSTETINREQMGGTAVAAIGRIGDIISDKGTDHTGLGRWSWLRIGTGKKTTRLLCGYLPC